MKKLAHTLAWITLTGALAAGLGAGCAGGAQVASGGTGGGSCQAGTFRNCNCDLLTSGTQACAETAKIVTDAILARRPRVPQAGRV